MPKTRPITNPASRAPITSIAKYACAFAQCTVQLKEALDSIVYGATHGFVIYVN